MIKLIKETFYKEKETKRELCNFIHSAKQLSMGKKCLEFERKFSKWQGRHYSVLFNSGASSNLALMQSLKNMGLLKKGDKVGFSALTWSTNVMPIIQMGFEPIPIDICVWKLNVNGLEFVKFVENNEVKCVFLTNALGLSCEYDIIKYECNKRNIIVLEDNCESIGTTYGGEKTGNFGLASTFSFFTGHQFSTIEGGMVTTNDPNLYSMLKMVRANGWARNINCQKQKELYDDNNIDQFYQSYTFFELAYNLRPTEITGYIGSKNIENLNKIIKLRHKNYVYFINIINKNNDFYEIYEGMPGDKISSFAIPVICKTKKLKEQYIERFKNKGVEIRPVIAGDITHQPFWKKYIKKRYNLPNTKIIHECGFYFPNYPELSEKEINIIRSCLV